MLTSATSLIEMLGRVLTGEAEVSAQRTEQRILDAVIEELLVTPLRKLTLEDVARRAGLTRMTVYRRFGDREGLIQATLTREVSRFLGAVQQVADAETEPAAKTCEAFATGLHLAYSHPLVEHWRRTDPGALLNYLLADNGLMFAAASAMIADNLATLTPPPRDPLQTAEILARLFTALVLIPPTTLDLTDPDAARQLARDTIAPLALTTP
ncbi:TetR/AcrR family transcriptional regulator [Nocardia ninae]|uniref:TetR/AcrR family transcriptional regulator n=2 Tax=Nocardia ninae TaxID=356145 RepID=UPI001649F865|nr:TetR/AcrR family transcriptional regulator [Nocardia ninae]